MNNFEQSVNQKLMKTIMVGDQLLDVDSKYDPDNIPPNFMIASLHQKATKVGRNTPEDEVPYIERARCPCCLKWAEKKEMPIGISSTKLSFLGTGVPLFFDFIKQCVLILVILFCTSGDYNLITNIVFGTSCQKDIEDSKSTDNCDLNYITQSSLANKRQDSSLMNLQQMLNLVSIFIIVGLLHYSRIKQRSIQRDCDFNTITASDYAVKISHIPTENPNEIAKKLREILDEYLQKYVPYNPLVLKYMEQKAKRSQKYKIPNRIQSITLCYDISHYQELAKKKEKLISEKQKYLTKMYENYDPENPLFQKINGEFVDNELNEIEKKLINCKDEIKLYFDKFLDENNHDKQFVGFAFVTFQWESDQETFLSQNRTTIWGRYFGEQTRVFYDDTNLVIDEAPEPNDIQWNNLHISNNKKIINRVIGFILISLQLAITSSAIFYISKLQRQLLENENTLLKKLASLASIIIIVINYFLSYSIKKIALFQGFSTFTGYHTSVATSSGVAQFVNSALVTWLVFTLLMDENYYEDGGLIYNQAYVFVSNMIISNVISLVDIFYWIRVYKRHKEESKQQYSTMTQNQLNALYENPEETLSDRYAGIIKTMFMTSFYASIIPLGILFSICGLTISYWVYKFIFIKRRTFKQSFSFNLSIEMTENLEFIIPIYCFSNFWFQYAFTKGQDVSSFAIIGIVIGIVNAILPMYDLNQALFNIDDYTQETKPFKKIQRFLDSDYHRNNPATQEYAKEKFIKSIRKK